LDTTIRWGLDTEFGMRRENLGTIGNDSLWTGDANLTFRFAQSPQLFMRTGIGVNWLSDRFGTEAGLNFTYGAEWFPADPFIVTSTMDVGTIGHTDLLHFRTELGLIHSAWEPFVGYDYFAISGSGSHEIVAGLRFWF
jgi:hypothetical protein